MPRQAAVHPLTSRDAAAEALLDALRRGEPVPGPVAVVVAHPDDETLGLGLRLASLQDLTLVHVTDGAPRSNEDGRRAGFPDRSAYREARAWELGAALERLGARPRQVSLGVADQEAVMQLGAVVRALAEFLSSSRVVFTHSYEGGHPDHDATAFAVQHACALIRARGGEGPLRAEFAGYHLRDDEQASGVFWEDADHPSVRPRSDPGLTARKREALARFTTQADVVACFDPSVEGYRLAPTYDFSRPPPPGNALYDRWDWPLDSALWREAARQALADIESTASSIEGA